MNIGVVNVIHLLKKKEGRSKSKILTGDPVLNGMWKSKHHTWLLRHFSQVLDSLGKFGTRMIPTLTIRKWRYWQPYPSTSTYNWDGTSHLQFGGGGEEGYSLWAHEIQGFESLFSSSETFGFQLCLPKTSQELPTMLSHLCCFTAFISAVTSNSKLTEWSRRASELLIKEDLSIFPQDKQYCTSRLY